MNKAARPADELGHRLLPRRSMLILGTGLGLGIAGCTADNSPAPPEPSASPTPQPEPLPGTVDGAALESSLAEFAYWTATVFEDDLSAADARLLSALQVTHRQHAAVLSAEDVFAVPGPLPSDSPTGSSSSTPSPSPSPSTLQPPIEIGDDLDAAFANLASLESTVAEGHQRLAVNPLPNQDHQLEEDQLRKLVLLWGSLAAAASGYAAACKRRVDPGKRVHGAERVAAVWPGPVEALQHVLQQTYAMIFGYQTAIAAMLGKDAERARSRLSALRNLRDELSGRLADGDHQVPSPHPAYQLPVQPTNGSKARKLLGRMEAGYLPHLGQWLGTETDDRTDPIESLIMTSESAGLWSPAIQVWPGWPT